MTYIFGINILSDKLLALNARHQERWVKLKTVPFDWHGTKGKPRPLHTYRAQRRGLQRVQYRLQRHSNTGLRQSRNSKGDQHD